MISQILFRVCDVNKTLVIGAALFIIGPLTISSLILEKVENLHLSTGSSLGPMIFGSEGMMVDLVKSAVRSAHDVFGLQTVL